MNSFSDFTRRLWQGGNFSYFWTPDGEEHVDPDGQEWRDKVSYWFGAGTPAKVPAAWVNNCNVYWGVHPTQSRGTQHSRAKIEDVAAVNALFAEFDVPKNFLTKDAVLVHLAALPLQPSAIIDSGGGIHAYWILADTYTIDTDASRERIQSLQYAWVDFVGSDPGAKDLARVLRVPGTKNRKPQYAPNFPAVQFLQCDLDQTITIEQAEVLTADLRAAQPKRKATVHPVQSSGGVPADSEFWTVAFGGKYGHEVERLFRGDLSGHGNDHSAADYDLCRHLVYYAGDGWEVDRLFRQSGLMREKWEDRADYRDATIQRAQAATSGRFDWVAYTDKKNAVAAAQAAVGATYTNGNGHGHTNGNYANGAGPTMSQPGTGPKSKTKTATPPQKANDTTWVDYVNAAISLGYDFRINDLDDAMEVNGTRISDVCEAQILSQLHALGFRNVGVAKRALMTAAALNRYHPAKEYLAGIVWNGQDHIARLAAHFDDAHRSVTYPDGMQRSAIHAFLRRWLIGAVGKVYNSSDYQNPMLILAGGQDLGKSSFAKWICPLPNLHIEGPIKPEDKDYSGYLSSRWVWEVGELGATMRKADRESLKQFLTQQETTYRPSYGHYSITKPAMASFIGTVNPEGALLADPTGNRRFWPVTLNTIDWNYRQVIDKHQVWAQAHTLYNAGEEARLTPEEKELHAEITLFYEAEDILAGFVQDYFRIEPGNTSIFTTTSAIISILRDNQGADLKGSERALSMQLAATLHSLGLERVKKRGGPLQPPRWGYVGIEKK